MKNRTKNTLFMLSSVDGKISTGNSVNRDTDKDFRKIKGVREGLQQYYDLEQKTELHSFNTGKVMSKMGVNDDSKVFSGLDFMSFIIVDNTHLEKNVIENLCNNLKKLYLVTSNKSHPAFSSSADDLEIIFYEDEINFQDLFVKLKEDYDIDNVTIQSGGTMNSVLLREKLIDEISIVFAPLLIGGKDTHTLVDGTTLFAYDDLRHVKALELLGVDQLENSYLHLRYKVINDTEIV